MIRISIDLVDSVCGRHFKTTSYCYILKEGSTVLKKLGPFASFSYCFVDLLNNPCFPKIKGKVGIFLPNKFNEWMILLQVLKNVYDQPFN